MLKRNALVVVAIDFGTTYSGYAFSFREDDKQDHANINTNVSWASGDGLITPKTPTAILFDRNQKFVDFGYESERLYAEASDNDEADDYYFFDRYKMKLFQNEEIQEKRQHRRRNDRISADLILKDIAGKPMKAIQVFSESIRFLKDHFLKSGQAAAFDFQDNDVHWVLTVPAIWKDNAKQFMRRAAQMAGIKQELLTLAYEPEAAAICCKEAKVQKAEGSKGYSLQTFAPGQQFMVLDCGGGTIDITSYEVQEKSALKELDRPTGGPWGGMYVDEEYVLFLKDMLGEDVWKDILRASPEDVLEIKRQFELKKRGTKMDSSYQVTISDPILMYDTYKTIKGTTLEDGLKSTKFKESVQFIKKGLKLRLEPTLMEQFFKNPVESIIFHVKNMLDESIRKGNHISTILMVGGFSDSSILQERIKREFSQMRVICPPDAVLAVVKGAVMYGHNPQVILERKCPRTYGITVTVPFNKQRHPESLKSIVEQREMCTDVFEIMAMKGDSLVIGQTFYEITCNPSRSTDTEATVEVYESINETPVFTTDSGVKRLGYLTVPIPDVEKGKKEESKSKCILGIPNLLLLGPRKEQMKKSKVVSNVFQFDITAML